MIAIVALLLSVLYLLPLLWETRQSRRAGENLDLFGPTALASAVHLLTTVPFLLLAQWDPETISPLVRNHPCITDIETAVVRYGAVQALGFLSLIAGIHSPLGQRLITRAPILGAHFTRKRSAAALTFALGAGIASFALYVHNLGGLGEFLGNMDRRAYLSRGSGYLLSLLSLLMAAAMLQVYSLRADRPTVLRLGKTAALLVLIALIFTSFGGRLPTVKMILLVTLTWHYGVRRIPRISPRLIMIPLLLVPYMIALPLLREKDAVEHYRQNPGELVAAVGGKLGTIVHEISYVDQYILIVNYFHPGNIWLGGSYKDLLVALIPSSRFPDKPPVDDGVYVRTIAEGRTVVPGTPFRDLFPSSWPPETLGASYMNFWVPGAIVGLFLLGVIYALVYRYMAHCGYTAYSIYVYGTVLFGFHLSTLRIVQIGTDLVIATLFFVLFFGVRAASRAPLSRSRRRMRNLP